MKRTERRESGQAAVETAMVMPLMVFLTLGTIQLTMLQHARLMTEYAAYQAARAGIVWNGNNERMHDAAIVALVPTLGRSDSLVEFGKTWGLARFYDLAMQQVMFGEVGGTLPDTVNGSNLLSFVRIDTINPSYWNAVGSIWKIDDLSWREIDFDGTDSFPMNAKQPSFWEKFLNFRLPDKDEVDMRKVTVLSIRVRYFYEMNVPFVNYVIFHAWYAAVVGKSIYGAIDRGTTESGVNMMNREGNLSALKGSAGRIATQKGYDTMFPIEMNALWMLANGSLPLGLSKFVGKHYFIPVTATYSMRMQSNFHYKWLMHLNPDWNL